MKRIISVIITMILILTSIGRAKVNAAITPKLQILTQPQSQYTQADTIAFTVWNPSFTGKVEYRVILYNGTTKKTTNLWNTPRTGYFYRGWQPSGTTKFEIHWKASQLAPGPYSMTVLVRKANSTSKYQSYVDTRSFFIADPGQGVTPGEVDVTAEDSNSIIIYPNQSSTEILAKQFFNSAPYIKVTSTEDFKKYVQKNLISFDNPINIMVPSNNSDLTSDKVSELIQKTLEENYRYGSFVDSTQMYYIELQENRAYKLYLKYKYTKDELVVMNREVDDKIKQIIESIITPSMSDYEKLKAIHDYVVNNTVYDTSQPTQDASFNIYGALIKGTAVCQGYSCAIEALLDAVGIESMVVISNEMNHAWNLVKLDGEYYHVDATWDDPVTNTGEQVLRYNYFSLTDEEIKNLEHTWDYGKYPPAAGTVY